MCTLMFDGTGTKHPQLFSGTVLQSTTYYAAAFPPFFPLLKHTAIIKEIYMHSDIEFIVEYYRMRLKQG